MRMENAAAEVNIAKVAADAEQPKLILMCNLSKQFITGYIII